jgi:F-type H+-transporting ATPase subunit a
MEISHNMISFFGLQCDLWITIMTWLVMGVIILMVWLGTHKLDWIPKGWQNIMEVLVEFIENNVKDSLGTAGLRYTYFFGSLFLFILVANMLGLVPGLASPTREVSVTLALAFLVVVWMQYIALRECGVVRYLKHFIEPFPPFILINLMELVTRPLTLALRLFGNIFAGEILVAVLTKNFPILAPSLWLMMSVFIGGIQAYIFTVLSLAYTGLSINE